MAEKIKLHSDQQEASNNSLEEINLLREQMIFDLSKLQNPTLEDADRIWEENRELIDDKAFEALDAVRNFAKQNS